MKNMKKVFAFVLALAMILTTYQPTTTYAATKAPTISAKKMTLQVGSKKTLTVKKAGKNATLKWSSSKKSVATVSKKGVVKAVKAGTANVKCKVVTKGKKHYTLTCKVTVKNAAVSKTVSTQKALVAALKDKNVKNLTIKTDKEVAFNIPSGNYGKVNLTVDAPNADVVNAGTFKSINIKAIKPNTWKEKAKGNTITVTADDARIVVEAGASLSKVTVSQEGGKIKIEAAGTIDAIQIDAAVDVSLAVDGTVGEVAVSAPAKVAVEGKTTTAIPVKVEETAKGADVTSSTPVEVKAATEISLNLSKGAEGSKVETTGENAQVAVKNDTTDVIKVTTPAGTKEVAKDTTSKVDNTGKVTDTTTNTSGDNNGGSTGGGSTSGGGSSSGGSVTPAPTPDPDPAQTVIHVFEKNQIDIEIPTEIIESNKDKIIVTDGNGVTQKIASLKDMDDEEEIADNEDNDEDYDDDDDDGTKWYRYMLTFASNLNPGKYTLSYIDGNTKYEGTFQFEVDDFEKTAEAAKNIQKAFFENTFEIFPDGQTNTRYAYEQLSKKVIKYAGGDYYADVFGGCDEKYIEKDGKTGLKVTIRVGTGDVVKDITGIVYFTFTKEKTEVKEPVMAHKTQTSIVVKAEDGQEYICCKEGTEENAINWDDAIDASKQDAFGFIQFSDLETNNKYVIYTRNTEQADEVKKSIEIPLSDKDLSIICLAKTDNTNISLKEAPLVQEEDSFYIEVPYTVSVQDYGKTPEGYRTSGEATAICTKTGSDSVDVAFVGLPESGIAKVWFAEELSAGNYTIHLTYKYVCEEDNDIENPEKLTASDPITYIVTFTVKDTENK
ncbi:MAG: Ig-like domain-containing protein [Agathobacter sp.]